MSSPSISSTHKAVQPTTGDVELLSAENPENPFVTPEYVHASKLLGFQPVLFTDGPAGDKLLGFIRKGRLAHILEVHSCASVSGSAPIWTSVGTWARENRVSQIVVGSAASRGFKIPSIGRPVKTGQRSEFVIRLKDRDIWESMNKSHRDRVKKARKAGVQLTRSRDPERLSDHLALQNASMIRRARRGENVTTHESTEELEAYLQAGAGEVIQAIESNEVLSSMVVLRAPTGVYSVSSGNSPRGMECGASHFLTFELAVQLQAEGFELFNRAGAKKEETGLREFKAKFGSDEIELGYATLDVASPGIRLAQTIIRKLRRFR